MKVRAKTVELTLDEADIDALRLLLRHYPMWFRENSDGRGTHEKRAREIIRGLVS